MSRKILVLGSVGVVVLVLFMMFSVVVDAQVTASATTITESLSNIQNKFGAYYINGMPPLLELILRTLAFIFAWLIINSPFK